MQLARHRFFTFFPTAHARELIQLTRLKSFPAGTVLFDENDASDAVFLVLDGLVELTKKSATGETYTIKCVQPGEYFGEIGVLDGSGRSAGAKAASDLTVGVIGKKPFLRVLGESPWQTTMALFSQVSANLRETNRLFVEEVLRKEKMTLVGEMANGIIHDFKSPFTSIRLATEMLALKHPDSATQDWCRSIRSQIGRMAGMVEEILEFSRGETRLEVRSFPLQKCFDELVEFCLGALRRQDVRVEIQPTNLVVCLDRSRVTRVLQNLLLNAAESIPKSRNGEIALKATRKSGRLILAVADNGSGIPKRVTNRIFQPFESYGKSGGTGLGLAIARSIVEAHGGEITFTTKRGRGTTFFLRFPQQT